MPTKIAAANSLHRFAEYDLPKKDHKFKKCNSLNFILACEPMLKERSFFALFRTVSRNSAASCLLNHYLHFPRTCNCLQVSFLFLKIITHTAAVEHDYGLIYSIGSSCGGCNFYGQLNCTCSKSTHAPEITRTRTSSSSWCKILLEFCSSWLKEQLLLQGGKLNLC